MIYPAISIRQPWAWAILHAGKDVENRTWSIPRKYLNTPVLIHAGKGEDVEGTALIESMTMEPLPRKLIKGGIIGAFILSGQNNAETRFSPWRAEGQNWWKIKSAWPVPFHPCRGQLGFFQVDYPYSIEGMEG